MHFHLHMSHNSWVLLAVVVGVCVGVLLDLLTAGPLPRWNDSDE
jgi:hypothetical protein